METMGQKFRSAREKKKMDLSRAASLTRIKVQHLERMEEDDFSGMPAPTYAKGFIRIYSELLGIDPEPLIREYIEKHLAGNVANVVGGPAKKPRPQVKKKKKPPVGGSGGGIDAAKVYVDGLMKKLQAIAPQTPKILLTIVGVLVLVGMIRCAVNRTGSAEPMTTDSDLLDSRAMMKEPSDLYLELPGGEENEP